MSQCERIDLNVVAHSQGEMHQLTFASSTSFVWALHSYMIPYVLLAGSPFFSNLAPVSLI